MFVELLLPGGLPFDRDDIEDALVEALGAECTGAGAGDGLVNLDLEVPESDPEAVIAGLRRVLASLEILGARAAVEGHGSFAV